MASPRALRNKEFLRRSLVPGSYNPEGPRVRLFVMGTNRWRDENSWPLARAREVRYFLHEGGRLAPDSPSANATAATFLFNPLDPVPTVGGPNLMSGSEGAYATGPWDQRRLDERQDILRFSSDVLVSDLEVTGRLSVALHAATTAVDTDWTAKLIDVWPDGRAFNVADGILRARYRNGTSSAELLEPGRSYLYEIDLVATSQVFLRGHRIRVDISSSNFPRFDRNPGTGQLSADTSEPQFTVARQTVFLDASKPSWIGLPVVSS
jgi:putative CocE/NonD family hydrolase